jgi:hypothetical protein
MDLADAVKAAIYRHYPVYQVVDADGHLIGVVRGWRLFERQAIEISAQSGQMVGVDKEERLDTGVWTAFKMRHACGEKDARCGHWRSRFAGSRLGTCSAWHPVLPLCPAR